MWVVAKIKKKEIETFKKDLIKKSGDGIEFYSPKIEYHQFFKNKTRR